MSLLVSLIENCITTTGSMLFCSLRIELVKYFNGCLVTRSKVMVIKTNSEHHKNDKSMNMNGGGDLPLGHLACLIIQPLFVALHGPSSLTSRGVQNHCHDCTESLTVGACVLPSAIIGYE